MDSIVSEKTNRHFVKFNMFPVEASVDGSEKPSEVKSFDVSRSRNIHFERRGSRRTLCNCRYNVHQIAVVRHSLSLSCLKDISSWWLKVSPLTSNLSKRDELWQEHSMLYSCLFSVVLLGSETVWGCTQTYWAVLRELSVSNHSLEFTRFLMLCF